MFDLEPQQPLSQPAPKQKSKLRRFLKALSAVVLSIILPGLGQALNRQWTRAVLFCASIPLLLCASGALGLMTSFSGLVAQLVVNISWLIFILIDAFRGGWRERNSVVPPGKPWVMYAAFVLSMSFHVYAAESGLYFDRIVGVRAFRLSAASMEPTIDIGDRIIVDVRAFKLRRPRRGELIVFRRDSNGETWIKRVIAVGGDTVSGDRMGVHLNGQLLVEPYARMPKSEGDDEESLQGQNFGPVFVPPGQVFLLGDNRPHSFDSRFPEYGAVKEGAAFGKPLYIYWSPDHARIGRRTE